MNLNSMKLSKKLMVNKLLHQIELCILQIRRLDLVKQIKFLIEIKEY